MDDVAALTHHLEYIFLKTIINELRNEKITIGDARRFSKSFIALEPFASGEDAQEKINKFTEEFSIFSDLKSYIDAYQKEKTDIQKISTMREHLKNNNIEAALDAAKN